MNTSEAFFYPFLIKYNPAHIKMSPNIKNHILEGTTFKIINVPIKTNKKPNIFSTVHL